MDYGLYKHMYNLQILFEEQLAFLHRRIPMAHKSNHSY